MKNGDSALLPRDGSTRTGGARALSNLALVKYFGKRDVALNLPAAPSLSLTLEPLATTTRVSFSAAYPEDEVILNGETAPKKFKARVSRFLDILRELKGIGDRARVDTHNAFPTAAGLASSASGFAALTVAATAALELEMDEPALSALARRGSGSAARSVPGGISVWRTGDRDDGSDSFAATIGGPDDFDLRVVIGVCDPGPKPVGSTEAMEQTRLTSPYYRSWLDCATADVEEATAAVARRDVDALGMVTERSALSMHAAALAARPGIVFWKGPTIEGLHLARRLRRQGVQAYFTCDAGPQPKLLCTREHDSEAADALASLPGIVEVIRCRLGGGARVID